MASDNVVGPRDAPWLIVDAKYKNPLTEHHGDRFRNSDLYQAFTHAAALDAPAVLVYPRVDRDVDVVLANNTEQVRVVALELCDHQILGGGLLAKLRIALEV